MNLNFDRIISELGATIGNQAVELARVKAELDDTRVQLAEITARAEAAEKRLEEYEDTEDDDDEDAEAASSEETE